MLLAVMEVAQAEGRGRGPLDGNGLLEKACGTLQIHRPEDWLHWVGTLGSFLDLTVDGLSSF